MRNKFKGSSQLKNRIIIVLTTVLVSLTIAAYYLIIDDELNPEILPLVVQYNNTQTKTDNGSVYQMGFWAKPGQSPYEVGLSRIEGYLQAIEQNDSQLTGLEFEDPLDEAEVMAAIKKHSLLCDLTAPSCLNHMYDNTDKAPAVIQANQEYLDRYEKLMSFEQFKLHSAPIYTMPEILFGPALNLIRLRTLDLIYQFKQKQYKTVVQALVKQTQFSEKVLWDTPYTIAKINAIIELRYTAMVTAFLMTKTDHSAMTLWAPLISAIDQSPPKTFDSKKLWLVAFAKMVNSNKWLDIDAHHQRNGGFSSYLPNSFIYKPNRTFNIGYEWLKQAKNSVRFIGDAIQHTKQKIVFRPVPFDYSNIIGSLILERMPPTLIDFQSDAADIEIQWRIIKHLYLKNINSDTRDFIHPVNGQTIKPIEGKLCVDRTENTKAPICVTVF